mmetsp:Transcript_26498/g.57430  ORF Transcript_26498/g.57430 Transcript_26498/m.57430 type:complete len:425 (-) Transcript_26498:79-1353(-)
MKEDLFERGLRQTVVVQPHLLAALFDGGEGISESDVRWRHVVAEEVPVVLHERRGREQFGHKGLDLLEFGLARLHLQFVARSILGLEMLRVAQAGKATVHHDADTGAESVCLLHRVRCEHHRPPRDGLCDKIPHLTLGTRVHSRRGLVEVCDERVGDESDGSGEFAAVATTVALAHNIRIGSECHALHELRCHRWDVGSRDALELGEEFEMFTPCELRPCRVELRTIAKDLVSLVDVVVDVVTVHITLAAVLQDVSRQHLHDGGLSGAVGSEETETLPRLNAEAEVVDSQLGRLVVARGEDMSQTLDLYEVIELHRRFREPVSLRRHVVVLIHRVGRKHRRSPPQSMEQPPDIAALKGPHDGAPEHPGEREVDQEHAGGDKGTKDGVDVVEGEHVGDGGGEGRRGSRSPSCRGRRREQSPGRFP